jgi:hypothetical protein
MPIVAGAAVEYRFDEGAGTVLNDRSGGGNHGTLGISGSGLPTWSPAGLVFGGGGLAKTVQCPPAVYESLLTLQIWCSTAPPSPPRSQALSCGFSASGYLFLLGPSDLRPGCTTNFFGDPGICSGHPILGGNAGLSWVMDASSSKKVLVYADGVETDFYWTAVTPALPSPGTPTNWDLGSFGGSFFYTGTIHYLLGYARVLAPSEIAQNHAAVASVLSGRGVTPGATRAAGSGRPVLAYLGDSRTRGVGTSDTTGMLPRQTADRLAVNRNYIPVNYGLSGAACSGTNGLRAQLPSRTTPALADGTGRDVLVVWSGTNALWSGAELTAVLGTATDARAAGWSRVVVCTDIPATGRSDTGRGPFNQSIRDNAAGLGYSVADFAADSIMGDPAQTSNTTYFADGLHCADAGYARLGAILAPVVDAMAWPAVLHPSLRTLQPLVGAY